MLKDKLSKIESEIFATVNTIIKLSNEYQQGNLKDTFFQRSIKNAMDNLIRINMKLNEENLQLSEMLEKMNFTQQYHNAISTINEASSLDFVNGTFPKSVSSSLLKIPGISSEITSSFITLMDAIKLYEYDNFGLIQGLFQDLIQNLEKFPGLEDIKRNVIKNYNNLIRNKGKIAQNTQQRNKFVDEIYKVYKEFQKKLNLDG
jgi:hypothetical protein